MDIEAKARRFILFAIEIDKELTSIEIREKLRGRILVTSDTYVLKKAEVFIISMTSFVKWSHK